ncbi:hypothetical protein AERO8C_30203 [Aeromonas veronii]|uniref:Uncharacterized protein n=1 Tax=Aeromonas veronii TaxID=654 RepID=A0A653L5J7_AERVE|nr:hypothetical protein AERO8C_30203 [Aeromonas veronii]
MRLLGRGISTLCRSRCERDLPADLLAGEGLVEGNRLVVCKADQRGGNRRGTARQLTSGEQGKRGVALHGEAHLQHIGAGALLDMVAGAVRVIASAGPQRQQPQGKQGDMTTHKGVSAPARSPADRRAGI